jgi:hypothetical protein
MGHGFCSLKDKKLTYCTKKKKIIQILVFWPKQVMLIKALVHYKLIHYHKYKWKKIT